MGRQVTPSVYCQTCLPSQYQRRTPGSQSTAYVW